MLFNPMAFRADIIKMIEDMIVKIEDRHFKIDSGMKQDFVTFVNSFFKFHLDQTDINFILNANLLYGETDDVKVIIATDCTKTFTVPGCTIPMRDSVEAFVIVNNVIAYDSLTMRRFRKATELPPRAPLPVEPTPNISPPTAPETPALATTSAPTPTPTPAPTLTLTPATTSTPAPSSFNFSTTPTPAPAPAPSSFNFSTTPTTSSAFHLSTVPSAKPFSSPTNLFNAR